MGVFGFKDKFHAQLIGNHFCDHFSSRKERKWREKFATVFFGAETESQLTLQRLVFGSKDKFHAQLIGNHFSDDFSSKKSKKIVKKICNGLFRSGDWIPVNTPKTCFRF